MSGNETIEPLGQPSWKCEQPAPYCRSVEQCALANKCLHPFSPRLPWLIVKEPKGFPQCDAITRVGKHRCGWPAKWHTDPVIGKSENLCNTHIKAKDMTMDRVTPIFYDKDLANGTT